MSPMITIAGSGPSTSQIEHVTVATKRRGVPSDYIFLRFLHSWRLYTPEEKQTPLMVYYKHNQFECPVEKYYCDSARWDGYFKRFVRSKRPPQRTKPSSGLCAVFGVIERWNPPSIGLIGFDWVLDGNPEWEHDAVAEKACIESLIDIVDLRT